MGGKTVCKIGNRGVSFTFEDDITVYLIEGREHWFLCDTHLGPQSMEEIKQYISRQPIQKNVIVFNSHSDWDHIWGNCAFLGQTIIGHELCRKRMFEIGNFDVARLTEHHRGAIQIVLPNVTFSDRISFVEEEIEFIYAPGHTIDSAICFDQKDSVLFVGDLVEDPIPYLDFGDLELYINTLKFVKAFPAKVKITAHSGIVDNELIDRNITYIQDVLKGREIQPTVYQTCLHVHRFNINNRLYFQYEKMIREKLQDNFDYPLFRNKFEELKHSNYSDLERGLKGYFAKL